MTISRRDFLNGVSIGIIAGLTPIEILKASTNASTHYYPPALTGVRGNHEGSYETAHKAHKYAKKIDTSTLPIEENYDLVVVGGGISGLAAAYYYQKRYGTKSRILILDNHDDFGGHAKRNEFTVNGKLIIGYGGTESFHAPNTVFSKVTEDLLKELSVDIKDLGNCFNKSFYPNLKMSRGVFFDKETFGQNKIVTGDPGKIADDDIDKKDLNAKNIKDFINEFPLSKEDKDSLISLHDKKINYLPNKSVKERENYLSSTSYRDFLIHNVGLSETAIKYFQGRSIDFFSIGIDAISALDARVLDMPGLDGMELPPLSKEEDAALNEPYIYHFPDGLASLPRLLVRKLIPKAAPGNNMNDIVLTKFDYSKLDLPDNSVRLRLNSTVILVKNLLPKGVDVVYMDKARKLRRVQTKHTVMACYNSMVPYLMKEEISKEQKKALKRNVKSCMVYTNVIIRNWQPFIKLGVHEIYSPAMPYSRIKLDYPVNMGGYLHPKDPNEPICLHMVYVPLQSKIGKKPKSQYHKGRSKLLHTPFSELESDIRKQLQQILGPAGFNHEKDILAITVNRWAHGYSYFYNSLFDDWSESQRTIYTARAPIGNVTIANSDSAWDPYAHAAIDMAHRAVYEFKD